MKVQFPKKREIERYLHIREGSLDHIPHYAINSALLAIANIRKMEKEKLFRPGLYYIVLSDLCRSTQAAARLGQDLNKRRVESFILTCIEALGNIQPINYFLPIREIGDAVLIIFSSFKDAHNWWLTMHEWLAVSNGRWQEKLSKEQFAAFSLNAKTVVHLGEVAYSDDNIPVALAVNQVFKIEKLFGSGELGLTYPALLAAVPILRDLNLRARSLKSVHLPGDKHPTATYVVDRWKNTVILR